MRRKGQEDDKKFMKTCVTTRHIVAKCCSEKRVAKRQILPIMASEVGSLKAEIGILIRVAERFFSGVPQPPPPWRLLPESLFLYPVPSQPFNFPFSQSSKKTRDLPVRLQA